MKVVLPPQAALHECKVLGSRSRMLDLLPKNAMIAELKTRDGRLAREILDRAAPSELHLADSNWIKFEREVFSAEIDAGQVKLHTQSPSAFLASFPELYFDWIYMNASHEHSNVRRDAASGASKVKPGGCLVFNNYVRYTRQGDEFGVISAVNQLLVDGGWTMRYFALQRAGFHDVVLQKAASG